VSEGKPRQGVISGRVWLAHKVEQAETESAKLRAELEILRSRTSCQCRQGWVSYEARGLDGRIVSKDRPCNDCRTGLHVQLTQALTVVASLELETQRKTDRIVQLEAPWLGQRMRETPN
jgi:hypothetical protein